MRAHAWIRRPWRRCFGHRRDRGGADARSAGRRTLRPERCGEFSTNNVDYSTRPALGVLQVQALLGPDLTSRDEEALVAGHRGVGVDDAEVDARHPGRIIVASRYGDIGRHVEKEPSRLG